MTEHQKKTNGACGGETMCDECAYESLHTSKGHAMPQRLAAGSRYVPACFVPTRALASALARIVVEFRDRSVQ